MRHAGAHSISQQHYALSSLQQGNVSDWIISFFAGSTNELSTISLSVK
jgi:hypothetical protein